MAKSRTDNGVAAWKQRGIHDIDLPSGMQCKIRLPNLMQMMEDGVIPNSLRDVLLKRGGKKEIEPDTTPEQIAEMHTFARDVVAKTVVEPQITPEDVLDLPQEDGDVLFLLAMREAEIADYQPKQVAAGAD